MSCICDLISHFSLHFNVSASIFTPKRAFCLCNAVFCVVYFILFQIRAMTFKSISHQQQQQRQRQQEKIICEMRSRWNQINKTSNQMKIKSNWFFSMWYLKTMCVSVSSRRINFIMAFYGVFSLSRLVSTLVLNTPNDHEIDRWSQTLFLIKCRVTIEANQRVCICLCVCFFARHFH